MIFLCSLLPSLSGRWVGSVQSKEGQGDRRKTHSYQPGTAYRGSSMWLAPDLAHCSCPGAWLLPGKGPLTPWGCRTLGIWLLAGDLSSSLMTEELGAELLLETGCSFWESDGSSFVLFFLRFTVGLQQLAPPGMLSLSLLFWPTLWLFFSFHLLL